MSTLDAVPTHDLASLSAELTGRFATSSDPDWDELRTPWNLSVDQHPEAVVRIAGAADAAAVIGAARRLGLRVAAQGTGHLAAALGDLSDTVLIRTDALREITVDPGARTVRAGAGVTWGEVSAALAPYGLAALAGSSHDVGIVGYTLGGGCSWLARSRGLAASAVTAIEIVTGDGRELRATATAEPDLFWALRGGGGAFGVVTALEFEVFDLPTVYAGSLLFPLERADEVLRAYADWTRTLPDEVTTAIQLLRMPPLLELPEFVRGRELVMIDGAVIGDDAVAERLLAPMRALGPETDLFERIPATRLQEIHMDPPMPVPARGGGLGLETLTDEIIDVVLAAAGPGVTSPLLAVEIRHLGGALGRPDPHGGAVAKLDGDYLFFAVGVPPEPEAVVAVEEAVFALREALTPWAAATTYSNFVEEPVPASALFGEETLARLRSVEDVYDPDDVIRSAHELR